MIDRLIKRRLKQSYNRELITVITGMRRVGKTTLLNFLFAQEPSQNKLKLDLEDLLIRKEFEQENYKKIEDFFSNSGLDLNIKAFVFIDEIQYIKNISSVIKYFYDKYKIKFVATGSSSFYIKNHFTESLAGRKELIELHPLTFIEFLLFKKEIKNLPTEKRLQLKKKINSPAIKTKYKDYYKEYIKYGGFPEVVLSKDFQEKEILLKDIINSYFQIDVKSLSDFVKISELRDLLLLLTQRIGSKIDISTLATNLKISREKIYAYIEFLKSTYIIDTISQKSSIDNSVSSLDKLYFLDTGLANTLASIDEGNQFENSVFMNLCMFKNITYFESTKKSEIDFIIDKKIGYEVKRTATKRKLSDLKRRSFSAKIPEYYMVSLEGEETNKVLAPWEI